MTCKPRGGRQCRLAHQKSGQLSHVSLRCPTYRENSHANHTWNPASRQTACFKGSEAPSPWVRFPSPAPLFCVGLCPRRGTRAVLRFQSLEAPQLQSLASDSEDAERDIGGGASNKRNPAAGLRICASIHQLPGWTNQSDCLAILPIVRMGANQYGVRNNYQ
jgi:hypothetical protein